MPQTLIFDLSEVLIAGLLGIERPLSARLHVDEERILPAFGGPLLRDLCCGLLSEEDYLNQVITTQRWQLSPAEIKPIIRANFRQRVPGMEALLRRLAPRCELVLHSDHAVEWVDYIHAVHPFLNVFTAQFFSFELKQTKREPSTFQRVLQALGRPPEQCFFVDDNPQNVRAAAAAGIPGHIFTSAEAFEAELAALSILKQHNL
ncbi:MAG: HAD-IA family hydrolase [Chloroflexota bacterium]